MILGVVLLVSCFLGAGHFLEAPAQAPVKADLLIALGGEDGGRAHSVLGLYRDGFAPRVLLTGEGVHTRARPHQLSWRARYLIDKGIPENAVLFDARSNNSWEEAVNTLALMRSMKLERVLVVSDPPHLRRLGWVWSKVFAGSGKTYTLIACEMDDWDPEFWWRTSAGLQFVFGEYIKLAYYFYSY